MSEPRGGHEIVRSDAGWRVRTIAANGEQLAVSEVLNSEEAAHVNVAAQVFVAKHGWLKELDERTGDGS